MRGEGPVAKGLIKGVGHLLGGHQRRGEEEGEEAHQSYHWATIMAMTNITTRSG